MRHRSLHRGRRAATAPGRVLMALVCLGLATAGIGLEWTPEMRRFRTTLVDHHPHRGRRLGEAEMDLCVDHFAQLQREVRLSILGHLFSDYVKAAGRRRDVARRDCRQI